MFSFLEIHPFGKLAMSVRNPLILTTAKSSLTILMKSYSWKYTVKAFEEEMLLKTLTSTLLQILFKIFLNFKVMVQSFIDLDNNFLRHS